MLWFLALAIVSFVLWVLISLISSVIISAIGYGVNLPSAWQFAVLLVILPVAYYFVAQKLGKPFWMFLLALIFIPASYMLYTNLGTNPGDILLDNSSVGIEPAVSLSLLKPEFNALEIRLNTLILQCFSVLFLLILAIYFKQNPPAMEVVARRIKKIR